MSRTVLSGLLGFLVLVFCPCKLQRMGGHLTMSPANELTESARQNKQTIPHSVKAKMPLASGVRRISGGKENVKKIHGAFHEIVYLAGPLNSLQTHL